MQQNTSATCFPTALLRVTPSPFCQSLYYRFVCSGFHSSFREIAHGKIYGILSSIDTFFRTGTASSVFDFSVKRGSSNDLTVLAHGVHFHVGVERRTP